MCWNSPDRQPFQLSLSLSLRGSRLLTEAPAQSAPAHNGHRRFSVSPCQRQITPTRRQQKEPRRSQSPAQGFRAPGGAQSRLHPRLLNNEQRVMGYSLRPEVCFFFLLHRDHRCCLGTCMCGCVKVDVERNLLHLHWFKSFLSFYFSPCTCILHYWISLPCFLYQISNNIIVIIIMF